MGERLGGTVAIVTGASSGIGEATAKALAAEGATVVVAARRMDRLDELVATIGAGATAVECDVTDRDQAMGLIATTIEAHGRIDTLINNAGVMLLGPIVDASPCPTC
jgi:NADP-dependent 3-hydroxy acid dehydrogenase YdfG